MKKIVLIASLCMFAGFSMAQKKAVKEAKSAMDKTAEARALIKPALTDPETANDPETWKVAGDIEFKSFDKQYDAEMTKGMLGGKGGDPEIMYPGLYNMIDLYVKADELAQQPDEKGKVKNKVRKDIIKNIKTGYKSFVNGGIYYNEKATEAARAGDKELAKKNYGLAADFFEMYWKVPSLELLAGENIVEQDTAFQIIKYYAAISAIQSEDDQRSIALLNKLIDSPYLANTGFAESDPYELLAEEYKKVKDTVAFVKVLKDGASKFKGNKYFVPNLINEYIRIGDTQAALDYIDQAIVNDPSSTCELLSLKGTLLSNDKKYAESIEVYEKALGVDANCAKALEGLGIVYVLEAQDVKEKVSHTNNRQELAAIDKETVELYQKAMPYLEKYCGILEQDSNVDEYELRRALQNLENIYYNLSLLNVDKSTELKAVQEKLAKLI